MSGVVSEPWERLPRQHEAAALGMWIFIATEVLFFGGLFAGYAVYRSLYSQAFAIAGRETDMLLGTLNTFVLLTSSLLVAVAERAAEREIPKLALWCFGIAIALGVLFLGLKGLEYHEDVTKHLVPGPSFGLEPPQTQIFFAFYWIMTGLHAVHVTGGAALMTWLVLVGRRRRAWLCHSGVVTPVALYWHLVDTIWVLLYPCFYLLGRAG